MVTQDRRTPHEFTLCLSKKTSCSGLKPPSRRSTRSAKYSTFTMFFFAQVLVHDSNEKRRQVLLLLIFPSSVASTDMYLVCRCQTARDHKFSAITISRKAPPCACSKVDEIIYDFKVMAGNSEVDRRGKCDDCLMTNISFCFRLFPESYASFPCSIWRQSLLYRDIYTYTYISIGFSQLNYKWGLILQRHLCTDQLILLIL